MSEIVEAFPFPEHAREQMQAVLKLCEGKDVQTTINVMANVICIVVRAAEGDFETLRKFMNDMIDAHAAAESQKQDENTKS